MPIYDYVCKGCEGTTSVLEKYDAKEERTCSACGGHDMERQLPIFGIGKGSSSPSSSSSKSSCSGCSSGSCSGCGCGRH